MLTGRAAEDRRTPRVQVGAGRVLDNTRLAELAVTRLGFTQFADPTASSTSGTPLYYAPEVLSGQPVTLKADVYALGVIVASLGLFWRTQLAKQEALAAASRAESVTRYLLSDVLGSLTNPAEPVQSLTVLQLLDHAAERVAAAFKTQPQTASQLQLALGDAYWQFGKGQPAARQLEQGLNTALAAGGPVTPTALRTAALLVHLEAHEGTVAANLARYQTLLAQGSKQLGERNLDVLILQERLAFATYLSGHYHAANQQFHEVLRLSETTPGAEAVTFETRFTLGTLLMRQAQYPEAEAIFKNVLTTLAAAGKAEDRDVARTHMRLGLMLTELGRLDEAGRIIKRWEPVSGYMSVVIALNRVRLAQERGDLPAAYALEQAVEALKAKDEASGGTEFGDYLVYAHTRLLDQKYPEALALLHKAETLLASHRQADNPDHVELALEKARVLLAQNQPAAASQTLAALPAQAWALLPANHPWNAERLLLEAKAGSDAAAAKTKLLAAQKIFAASLGSNHRKTREAQGLLAGT